MTHLSDDPVCLCSEKWDSIPAQMIICPLHPCICMETQNIDCEYCNSEGERLEQEEDG